jgi:benzodiazapine receptor
MRERPDSIRVTAVLAAAVLQTVAGGLGGSGAVGESVGVVAMSYPNPVLPSGAAFGIWTLIYVAVLVLAVRQALPGQRGREVHRRTGWLLTAAGVLNAAWILAFSQRWIAVSEVVIVALLGCLAVAYLRLAHRPAEGWGDRLFLHGTVAVYTGWVSVASVVGAVTTATAAGVTVPDRLGAVLLLAAAALVAWLVIKSHAVVGYVAAVVWALGWIAAASADDVRIAALISAAIVVAVVVVRAVRASDSAGLMWG